MTQKKMVVLFKSVKVVGRTSSYHPQLMGSSYWKRTTTYDMRSVSDHMLTLTRRDRLLLPETWILTLLLVLPVLGMVAIFMVLSGIRTAHSFVNIVILSLVSLPISLWLGYLWSVRFLNRAMRQKARKDRGSSRAEQLACVRIEDWPKFAPSLMHS